MVAHQLDLFGGPLKPPKKIKEDEDIPVEEPQKSTNDNLENTQSPNQLPAANRTEIENPVNAEADINDTEPLVSLPGTDGNPGSQIISESPGEEPDVDTTENHLFGEQSVIDTPGETGKLEDDPNLPSLMVDETAEPGKQNTSPEEIAGDSLVYVEAPSRMADPGNIGEEETTGEAVPASTVQDEINKEFTPVAPPFIEEQVPLEEQHFFPEQEAVIDSEPVGSDELISNETEKEPVDFTDAAGEEAAILPGEEIESTQHKGRKPNQDQEDELHLLNIPEDEQLFKRQYYSMRETAAMFSVNQSLLRFWENEFDILQPKKNKKGDRYFRPVDIKNLVLIYHLLRVRKFTMEGAKDYLQSHKKAGDTFELIRKLEKLKSFLLELKAGL